MVNNPVRWINVIIKVMNVSPASASNLVGLFSHQYIKPFSSNGQCRSEKRLPDFSWYKIPKCGKHATLTQNVPNYHKIYQMGVKYAECP
jgi:hypothetical protein